MFLNPLLKQASHKPTESKKIIIEKRPDVYRAIKLGMIIDKKQ